MPIATAFAEIPPTSDTLDLTFEQQCQQQSRSRVFAGAGIALVGVILASSMTIIGWSEWLARSTSAKKMTVSPELPLSGSVGIQPDSRQWATAEALRRNPSLGVRADPEALETLRQAVDGILREQQTLDDLRAVQAAEAEAERTPAPDVIERQQPAPARRWVTGHRWLAVTGLVVILALATLTAVVIRQSRPTGVASTSLTGTASTSLKAVDWGNRSYPASCDPYGQEVQMSGGKASTGGFDYYLTTKLVESVQTGQVGAGTGATATPVEVVVVHCNPGASTWPDTVLLYAIRDGRVVEVGRPIGQSDDEQVRRITTEDGGIIVVADGYSKRAPTCCPDQTVVTYLTLDGPSFHIDARHTYPK